MERLYSQIGRTRQSYHQALSVQESQTEQNQMIIDHVLKWRTRHPRMGSRSLYYSMLEAGIDLPLGVTSFERLLSKKELTVGTAKRSSPLSSDGIGRRNYLNLTNGLVLTDINQLIVADITYFWVAARWCYLFILKDVYSQRIISIVPSENMKAENGVRTLTELKRLRGKEALKNCIHHSDNGSQYESDSYKSYLDDLKIRISRARRCEENGSSEQSNHVVKNMYLQHFGIRTFAELQTACVKVKRLMNTERAVKLIGNITVERFEKTLYNLPLEERMKKNMHDFDNDS